MQSVLEALTRDDEVDELGVLVLEEGEPRGSRGKYVLTPEHKLAMSPRLCGEAYREAVARVVRRVGQDDAEGASLVAALVNGECLTAWNRRRELVVRGRTTTLRELRWSALALTRDRKSPETWAFRRWVIGHHREMNGEHLHDILRGELDLCEREAAMYPRNYHLWAHRIWAVRMMMEEGEEVLESQDCWSEGWVRRHPSDHAAMHFREKVLEFALCCPGGTDGGEDSRREQRRKMLSSEFAWTGQLVRCFPGHETLWCHLRFIAHWFASSGLTDVGAAGGADFADLEDDPFLSVEQLRRTCPVLRAPTAANLEAFAREVCDDVKASNYDEQRRLAEACSRWIRQIKLSP